MDTKQKTRYGQVISRKMDKTAVVAVETLRHHPLYQKTLRRIVKYKAHDENNETKLGDKVRIVECRPISKQKRWRVAEILTRGEVAEVKPEEIS